jgi:hypothetical protein
MASKSFDIPSHIVKQDVADKMAEEHADCMYHSSFSLLHIVLASLAQREMSQLPLAGIDFDKVRICIKSCAELI